MANPMLMHYPQKYRNQRYGKECCIDIGDEIWLRVAVICEDVLAILVRADFLQHDPDLHLRGNSKLSKGRQSRQARICPGYALRNSPSPFGLEILLSSSVMLLLLSAVTASTIWTFEGYHDAPTKDPGPQIPPQWRVVPGAPEHSCCRRCSRDGAQSVCVLIVDG